MLEIMKKSLALTVLVVALFAECLRAEGEKLVLPEGIQSRIPEMQEALGSGKLVELVDPEQPRDQSAQKWRKDLSRVSEKLGRLVPSSEWKVARADTVPPHLVSISFSPNDPRYKDYLVTLSWSSRAGTTEYELTGISVQYPSGGKAEETLKGN